MGDAGASDAAAPPVRRRRDIRERMSVAHIRDWQTLEDRDLAIFNIVRPDGQPFFEFEPGQYVQLAFREQPLEDPRPRQYSIASSPLDRDRLEIFIILVRDELPDGGQRLGTFTRTLWERKPGDEILYMPRPAGRFVASRTPQRDLVCVATGTGLAPFISMARKMWRDFRQTGRADRRLTIVHGVSYVSQLAYRELLHEMAAEPEFGLLYLPVISRPERDADYTADLSRGRANDLMRDLFGAPKLGRVEPWAPDNLREELRRRLAPAHSAAYLCGNPGMIADVKDLLDGHGFVTQGRETQVVTEDYW